MTTRADFLTVEEVRRLFSYDPISGELTWNVSLSPSVSVGDVAGTKSEDYVNIHVNHRTFKAHVLAYVIVRGLWPENDIDHWDHDKQNNRWANLRHLTRSGNQQNHSGPNSNSTTGVRGVAFCPSRKKPWVGNITLNGKRTLRGFDTKSQAEEWVLETRKHLHPFCPENNPIEMKQ